MEVDDKLLKRINRSLRAIKFMLGFLFLLFLASLAILGFIAYKVVTFTHDVNNKITNIENTTNQNLDVKQQLCEGTSSNPLTDQLCN
jgi:predicted PurR-regulated permease PerM